MSIHGITKTKSIVEVGKAVAFEARCRAAGGVPAKISGGWPLCFTKSILVDVE